jgi:hypothetical protein
MFFGRSHREERGSTARHGGFNLPPGHFADKNVFHFNLQILYSVLNA